LVCGEVLPKDVWRAEDVIVEDENNLATRHADTVIPRR
jgi:hypothetical protein